MKEDEASYRSAHSQHVGVYVGRIQQTGDRLHEDEEGDDHQEQAVDETGQDLHSPVPTGGRQQSFSRHPVGSGNARRSSEGFYP